MKRAICLGVGLLLLTCAACGQQGSLQRTTVSASASVHPEDDVATLIDNLRHNDKKVRDQALSSLVKKHDGELRTHRVRLSALLNDGNANLRLYGAILIPIAAERGERTGLPTIGPEERDTLPILMEGLKGKEYRKQIATALIWLGSDAKPAVPLLVEAYKDDDFEVRFAVAKTLYRIERDVGAPLLVEVLVDPNSNRFGYTRYLLAHDLAVSALVNDSRLVPILIDGSIRWSSGDSCLQALGKIGPGAKEAVPFLESIRVRWISVGLSDPRKVALAAEKIGPMEPEKLQKALHDERDFIRVGAAFALANTDPGNAKPAVPILIKVIIDRTEPNLRAHAVNALAEIGPNAKEAVPVLSGLTNDQNVALRQAAFAALEKINKSS